jgi:hypothetical protein
MRREEERRRAEHEQVERVRGHAQPRHELQHEAGIGCGLLSLRTALLRFSFASNYSHLFKKSNAQSGQCLSFSLASDPGQSPLK